MERVSGFLYIMKHITTRIIMTSVIFTDPSLDIYSVNTFNQLLTSPKETVLCQGNGTLMAIMSIVLILLCCGVSLSVIHFRVVNLLK